MKAGQTVEGEVFDPYAWMEQLWLMAGHKEIQPVGVGHRLAALSHVLACSFNRGFPGGLLQFLPGTAAQIAFFHAQPQTVHRQQTAHLLQRRHGRHSAVLNGSTQYGAKAHRQFLFDHTPKAQGPCVEIGAAA